MTCSTCRWWENHGRVANGGEQGACRANPPALFDPEDYIARWPLSMASDWCGGHETRPGNDAAPGSPGR